MRLRRTFVVTLSMALTMIGGSGVAAGDAAPNERPAAKKAEVIGHRGASGYRPEHTLASYELAYRMGVNRVDVDLVPTKDGQLVARHENEIGGTTDVAEHPEFAGRKKTKTVDGTKVTGWFTEDFTLAELKTLRAKERIPDIRPRNTIYDGRYQIPTYQEVLDLGRRLAEELHRPLGTYPEVKHSTYFRKLGLPIEPRLVQIIKRNGLNHEDAPVVIQSFEVGNLKALHRQLRVPLLQLTEAAGAPPDFVASGDPRTYADLVTPKGLREIAGYADYLGPEKAQIIPVDDAGYLGRPTSLVPDAHQAGLKVVPYTFRNENSFLPKDFQSSDDPAAYGDAFGEYAAYLATGIDALFSDNADTALEATGR